jgi:DNA-binding response OmpR family regulator
MENPVILIVNANRSELETLSKELQQEGYDTIGAASPDELDQVVSGKKKRNLSIIDMSGLDDSIWERCDRMREAKLPFIIIAPQRSPTIQRDSMKHGASGLLVKPLAIKELIQHIHTALGD